MMSEEAGINTSFVNVVSTEGRGHTPEELAELTLARIIHVGEDSHPMIREQALEYKDNIRQVLINAFARAMKSERTTLYNLVKNQGHEDMAEIIKRL